MSTNAAATRSFLNINYNKKAAIYNIVSSTPSQSDYSTVSHEIVNEKSTATTSSSRNVLAFSKLAAALSAFISTKGTLAASTATATNATTTLPSATPRQLTPIPLHPTKPTPTTNIITNSKRPTIIIYPTVSPESIVIPIVSCILGFPLLALLVICCLRRRAKLARERDRRRNYDMQDHAVSLVRFSPIHRLNNRSSRAISLRPERSLSRGFPSLELDTVIEERSDPEQTQTDIISPESPLDPHKFRDFNSS